MPIEYRRDDGRRLIAVTMTDPFTLDDLLSQTDRQWAEHTWEYAVLYDSRASRHIPSPDEIQQLVDRTRIIGGAQVRGPVGVAVPPRPEAVRGGMEMTRAAGPRREIEFLLNQAQVNAWLTRHAPRHG